MNKQKRAALAAALMVVVGLGAGKVVGSAPARDGIVPFRTWTDRSGRYQLVAALVGFDSSSGTVRLVRPDGRPVRCALDRLSKADQALVRAGFAGAAGARNRANARTADTGRTGLSRAFWWPDVYVRLSRQLLTRRLGREVDESAEICDEILGTAVYGHGRTVGRVGVSLIPCSRAAVIDLVFRGHVDADTVGYNGPVRIWSKGRTWIGARKRIVVRPDRVWSLPALSVARSRSFPTGLETELPLLFDWLVRGIAWWRIEQQQPLADAIAADHAERRFNRQLDQQVGRQIARANRQWQQLARSATDHWAPRRANLATTASALWIQLQQAGPADGKPPVAPPPTSASADVTLWLHQSAINHLLQIEAGGKQLSSEMLRRLWQRWLGGSSGPPLPQRESWSLRLDDVRPVTVTIRTGEVELVMRASAIAARGGQWPAMNIMVRYRPVEDRGRWRLVPQGELVITPPRAEEQGGKAKLSAREVVLRRMLLNLLGPELLRPVPLDQLRLGHSLDQLGKPSLRHLTAADGWLLVGMDISSSSAGQRPASLAGCSIE